MSLSSAATNRLSYLRDIEKSPIRRLGIRALSCDQQVHTTDQGPLLRYDLPCFNLQKICISTHRTKYSLHYLFPFCQGINLKYKQKLVYPSIPDLFFEIFFVLLQDRNQLAPVIFAKGCSVDQHVLLNDEILVHD